LPDGILSRVVPLLLRWGATRGDEVEQGARLGVGGRRMRLELIDAELDGEVGLVLDEPRTGLDQPVRPGGGRRPRRAGNGDHVTAKVERVIGRDARAASD
jgi:hypothetical protein